MNKVFLNVLWAIVLFTVLFSIYNYRMKESRAVTARVKKEYVQLRKDSELMAKVAVLENPYPKGVNLNPIAVFISITNGQKYVIETYPDSTYKNDIRETLIVGDSLVKLANSNRLKVVRITNSDTIYFHYRISFSEYFVDVDFFEGF